MRGVRVLDSVMGRGADAVLRAQCREQEGRDLGSRSRRAMPGPQHAGGEVPTLQHPPQGCTPAGTLDSRVRSSPPERNMHTQ